ncbi:MAG TPA: PQQ-dependent sugar dehydrogenase, partial [Blastocatellia bacterium]|nr:PQQ-dependent sugar dehydrogenase [Blastocatellia bacterium]
RVRFMATAPDNRIFVTGMYNLADNKRGKVYVLEGFDPATGKVDRVIPFMTGLRNPNSIAFHTDPAGGEWFYLALTDKLLRYPYQPGETTPSGKPEVLTTFPDYGLSYKYGGWHLTRSVVVGTNEKLYVSAGSSCNACIEKEPIRATITEMDPDGRNQRIIARGIRNAVGLKWLDGKLYATDMGADHLGDDRPEDTIYAVESGANYGWPYCFQYKGRVYSDPLFAGQAGGFDCRRVPLAFVGLAAHSSPLGLEYFDSTATNEQLRDYFLVALHGSTKRALGRGYRISRVRAGGAPEDFITGFIERGRIHGRPAGILRTGPDSFLFTDDYSGVIYYVHPVGPSQPAKSPR